MKMQTLILGFATACVALGAQAGTKPETCLDCHGGSLDALAGKTASYKDEWGDAVNPHVYIDKEAARPHESKTLPDCLKCHEEHAVPPAPGWKPKKADVNYCFGCHHMETFEPCGQSGCHEKK